MCKGTAEVTTKSSKLLNTFVDQPTSQVPAPLLPPHHLLLPHPHRPPRLARSHPPGPRPKPIAQHCYICLQTVPCRSHSTSCNTREQGYRYHITCSLGIVIHLLALTTITHAEILKCCLWCSPAATNQQLQPCPQPCKFIDVPHLAKGQPRNLVGIWILVLRAACMKLWFQFPAQTCNPKEL